jgi:hypothetical protein
MKTLLKKIYIDNPPFWHFWNPRSGSIGGAIFSLIGLPLIGLGTPVGTLIFIGVYILTFILGVIASCI